MQVRDLMTPGIEAVSPLTTVKDAARKMKELQTCLLPVATGTGLIGMLTVTDITIRATAEGRDPTNTPVEDVMSLGIVACFEDQDIREALETMISRKVTQIPVLDRKRHLVGRLSVEDLVFQPDLLSLLECNLRESGDQVRKAGRPAD